MGIFAMMRNMTSMANTKKSLFLSSGILNICKIFESMPIEVQFLSNGSTRFLNLCLGALRNFTSLNGKGFGQLSSSKDLHSRGRSIYSTNNFAFKQKLGGDYCSGFQFALKRVNIQCCGAFPQYLSSRTPQFGIVLDELAYGRGKLAAGPRSLPFDASARIRSSFSSASYALFLFVPVNGLYFVFL